MEHQIKQLECPQKSRQSKIIGYQIMIKLIDGTEKLKTVSIKDIQTNYIESFKDTLTKDVKEVNVYPII